MDRIQVAADISIGRAVGFGALAVTTIVLGLIFEPAMALKTGSALTLLMAVILLLKSRRAPSQPYRQTEVWLILDKQLGLPEAHAQRVVGQILYESYQRYARWCLAVAIGLWLLGLAFQLLG